MNFGDCRELFDRLKACYPFSAEAAIFQISFSINARELAQQDNIDQVKEVIERRIRVACDSFLAELKK
jgi:hypothetical protein